MTPRKARFTFFWVLGRREYSLSPRADAWTICPIISQRFNCRFLCLRCHPEFQKAVTSAWAKLKPVINRKGFQLCKMPIIIRTSSALCADGFNAPQTQCQLSSCCDLASPPFDRSLNHDALANACRKPTPEFRLPASTPNSPLFSSTTRWPSRSSSPVLIIYCNCRRDRRTQGTRG